MSQSIPSVLEQSIPGIPEHSQCPRPVLERNPNVIEVPQCIPSVKFPKDFPLPTPRKSCFGVFLGWGAGKEELLMSLEPLPWEPVANGSLGFPLHSSRVSWEYRSHGNGCHRSLGGSGATALEGHKKLLFPSSREFLVGKGAPFCYSREFFGNTWTKNSQLDPLF